MSNFKWEDRVQEEQLKELDDEIREIRKKLEPIKARGKIPIKAISEGRVEWYSGKPIGCVVQTVIGTKKVALFSSKDLSEGLLKVTSDKTVDKFLKDLNLPTNFKLLREHLGYTVQVDYGDEVHYTNETMTKQVEDKRNLIIDELSDKFERWLTDE